MMWEPGKNNPSFILIGWVATSVFVLLMLYALIWLPYIERVGLPFDEYSPQLSYAGAAAGVVGILQYNALGEEMKNIERKIVDKFF